MNDIQVFENEEFGQIRTVKINGDPWFAGKDVALALGYKEPTKAAREKVDPEDRGVSKIDTPSGTQEMTVINESGLYSLVLSSKLPTAKKFKRWVTSEVLPAIRKTGGYIPTDGADDMEILARAVLIAQKTIEEKNRTIAQHEARIAADQPKVLLADAITESNDTILVGEMAKLLKQNGVEIGQNRLFSWLRKNGYLVCRQGTDYNMPTQRSMNLGLFEIKETVIIHMNGHTSLCKTPKVTGKGQQYFVNKFLALDCG